VNSGVIIFIAMMAVGVIALLILAFAPMGDS